MPIASESAYTFARISSADIYANELLVAIPEEEMAGLRPFLREEQYDAGRILFIPEAPAPYVYFPLAGAVISIISALKDGRDFQVCMAGNEGMVGLWEALGAKTSKYRAVVQIPGSVVKVHTDVIRSYLRQASVLQDRFFRYTRYVLTQTSQTAACNRAHRLEQRLARWLLMTRDRAGRNEFFATHEFLANMLGTPRSEVTLAAGVLRGKNAIAYHRGKITVLNSAELEATACECYKILHDELLKSN